MSTILLIWTIVGYAGTQISTHEKWDWRPLGEFSSPANCERAAAQLKLDPTRYRCILK